MNFNKFTIKASEAVQQAHDRALKMKHGKIDIVHLFWGMINQNDGFVPSIFLQMKVDANAIKNMIENELNSLLTLQ
jgi:ATP-dependent Clp protease ATP-binding subunit ClpB